MNATISSTRKKSTRKRDYSLTRCRNPVRHLRHWQPHPDSGLIFCPICRSPTRRGQPQTEGSSA
jgi:hypothetical protein